MTDMKLTPGTSSDPEPLWNPTPKRVGRKRLTAPDPTKCAIYARYSSAGQKELSIERQIELCTEYAISKGMTVVAIYVDRGMSGAFTVGRQGLELMVAGAKAGEFGVLILENSDRLARDLGVLSTTYKMLANVNVEMHQQGLGRMALANIAFSGLMADEGRRVMSERAQYSRNVMAREGKIPTGTCYGYARVPGQPGEKVIVEAEAAVVRRMFELRLEGLSMKQICVAIGSEGGTMPRTGIITNVGVQGILRNEIYKGLAIYGRNQAKKDRETSKRSITERPRSEWIVREVPHLRIVEDDVWDTVQATLNQKVWPAQSAANTYILSSLINCPCCHRRLVVSSNTFICNGRHASGACEFGHVINIKKSERVVLDLIGEQLDRKSFAEAYLEAYNQERSKAQGKHAGVRADLERKVAKLERMLHASFISSLSEGIKGKRVASYRAGMEMELSEAEDALAAMGRVAAPMGIDGARITTVLGALREVSSRTPFRPQDEAGMRLVAAIRELIDHVDVKVHGPGDVDVAVTLKIAALTNMAHNPPDGLGTCILTGSYHNAYRSYRNTPDSEKLAERYAKGEFALTDEELKVVHGLVSILPRERKIPPSETRVLIEAMVLVAITGVPWAQVPGPTFTNNRYRMTLHLRAAGIWDRVMKFLMDRDPVRYGGLTNRTPLSKGRANSSAAKERLARYANLLQRPEPTP